MSFSISHAQCFAAQVGESGLSMEAFQQGLRALAPIVAGWKTSEDPQTRAVLDIARQDSDLPAIRDAAKRLSENCKDIAVLGTGGSSLGGKTLYSLVDQGFGPKPGQPRLHFFDNVDPERFEALLERVEHKTLGLLIVSKSGGTAETLTQGLILLEALDKALPREALARQCLAVTEPGPRPLRQLAEHYGLPIMEHPAALGGRFSVLSLVGLLPAALAGLDIAALRAGAAETVQRCQAPQSENDAQAVIGATISVGLAREKGLTQSVLMSYADRLESFGLWYRQLWAESLGKEGKGTTPIPAVGAVDQHSQLQLYLDGPKDKLFTLIRRPTLGEGAALPTPLTEKLGLDYLGGRTLGDLLDAEARATVDSLIAAGRPTREILLERLDENTLGGLFMHFMLETLLSAELLSISAFGQPAVEDGKRRARAYLSEMK